MFLHNVCFFMTQTRYLYLRLPFLKMKDFRIILASLFFSLSRGNGEKMERLDAPYMVEIMGNIC